MTGERKKKILFGLVFTLLSMPLVQYNLNLLKSMELKGYYQSAQDTTFTKQAWWSGGYQEQKTKYINDNVGFRPDLVRISHQVDFSLFNMVHSNGILGKEQYLFYKEYIDAYLGRDFLGYKEIADISSKMKYLHDVFKARNKKFVMVFAPSKADCLPEYLPEHPLDTITGPTNREVYKRYFDSLGIAYIDFNEVFSELKKTKKRVFSKQGIHWTVYGATFAVDSFANYISRESNIPMPDFDYTLTQTDVPRSADNDIGASLNLITPMKESFIYPTISIRNDSMKNKPSAVYVGDSFMWLLIEDSIGRLHNHWEFWPYFVDAHRDGQYQTDISSYNWKGSLDNADYVFILYTCPNLDELPKCINRAYEDYKKEEAEPASANWR